MASGVLITLFGCVGIVALGGLITLGFHLYHRDEDPHHNPLFIPRFQYRPTDCTIKPHNIFEEHELNMIRTEILSDDGLRKLLTKIINADRNINCSCSSSKSSDCSERVLISNKQHVGDDSVSIEITSDVLSESCECARSKSYFTPECSVCLREFEVGDVVRILECGHYFHKDCIDGWLTKHSSLCPICKTDTREALGLVPHTILYPDARQRTESDFNGSRQGSGELNEGAANELTAPLPAVINTHSRAIRVELNV